VFNVTHAFLGSLRAVKGRIVNIGSIQSFIHLRTPSSPAYTASKHGVLGFTKALAAELGKDGVRVNAIGPGFIETPLNEKVRASNPDLIKVFIDHTPLGRAGKPEDIVGPAIFLGLRPVILCQRIDRDGGLAAIGRSSSDRLRQTTRRKRAMSNAPHYEIDVAAFWADPYPDLARMRRSRSCRSSVRPCSPAATTSSRRKACRRILLIPAGGPDEPPDGP